MFVREQNRDEYGLAMSYIFLGEASFVKSYGTRPMIIEWRLAEPGPASLLKESRNLMRRPSEIRTGHHHPVLLFFSAVISP